MTGPANSTNRFGSSSYIVGTPANGLGNGVNFTSIQSAINQAVADGYGIFNPVDIVLRAGVYIEDVTITDGGISLVGASSGSYNILSQQTFIQGTLTLNITGSNQFSLSNLLVSGQVGPSLAITGGASPVRMSATNCAFINVAGFAAVSMTNASGTLGSAIFTSCFVTGQECLNSSARTISVFNGCSLQGNVNAITLDGSARVICQYSSIQASGYGTQFLNAANQAQYRFCTVNSDFASIDLTPGGTAEIISSTISSGDPSGFFVIGTGNFEYCDVRNRGSSIGVDPGLGSILVSDWKPYSEFGTAPGVGVVRGTAAFNDVDFTVTDGFVSLLGSTSGPITQLDGDTGSATPVAGVISVVGGAGVTTTAAGNVVTIDSVVWTDQAAPALVTENSGSFDVGPVTLTLPAAPAQGDECRFFSINSPTVVQANVGQSIQIGNAISIAGGTATGSDTGDALVLSYNTAQARWCAISVIGNWTLA